MQHLKVKTGDELQPCVGKTIASIEYDVDGGATLIKFTDGRYLYIESTLVYSPPGSLLDTYADLDIGMGTLGI